MTATEALPEDDFSRPPPHDLAAERYVLAAMLWSAAAREEVGELLLPGDFYRPSHQDLYLALIAMNAADVAVDPITAADWIGQNNPGGWRPFGGEQEGRFYLADLYGVHPVAQTVSTHAEIVRERAIGRELEERLTRCQQRLHAPDRPLMTELIGQMAGDIEAAALRAADSDDPMAGQMTGRAFITQHRIRRPPLVAGLVHAMDRLVVIGKEGGGKSHLRDQFACCLVAGIHPFAQTPVAPLRVLIVDLENPPDMEQDRLEHMMELGAQHPGWDDDRLRIWSHPVGLDLRSPGDVHRLAANIRKARPDIVMAGPVKKMYREKNETADHAMVCETWDRLRIRFGFALLLEHHAPMGNIRRPWRPAGSGIWTSWPETGMAMVPAGKDKPDGAMKIITFRGHRRPGIVWPELLTRSLFPRSQWPWQATYPQGTLMDPMGQS